MSKTGFALSAKLPLKICWICLNSSMKFWRHFLSSSVIFPHIFTPPSCSKHFNLDSVVITVEKLPSLKSLTISSLLVPYPSSSSWTFLLHLIPLITQSSSTVYSQLAFLAQHFSGSPPTSPTVTILSQSTTANPILTQLPMVFPKVRYSAPSSSQSTCFSLVISSGTMDSIFTATPMITNSTFPPNPLPCHPLHHHKLPLWHKSLDGE